MQLRIQFLMLPRLMRKILTQKEMMKMFQMVPAQSTTVLDCDSEDNPHAADWKCCSVIDKLDFLEKSTRPELAHAVHQAACFSEEPKKSHTDFAHCIEHFLLGTHSEGFILDPRNHHLSFMLMPTSVVTGTRRQQLKIQVQLGQAQVV